MTILDIVREAAPELVEVDDKALYNAMVNWLFRGLNYAGLSARLCKLAKCKVRTNDVVRAVSDKGYVIKDYKLWIFLIVKKRYTEQQARALADKWGISQDDVSLFKLTQVGTLAYLKRLAKEYKALTLQKFDEVCTWIMQETKASTGRFAWAKLRFISNHQRTGLDLDDLTGEMRAKGMQGLMLMYPLIDTRLHALNIVKRTIRNTGLNLIQKYVRKKNTALEAKTEGGHQSRVLDIDNLPVADIPAAEPDRHSSDLFLDYKKLMERYKGGRRVLLGLLSGLFSTSFTQWLNDEKGINTPNDELIDRIPAHRYLLLCREYLGVCETACERFLSVVKGILKPYHRPMLVAA